MPDTGASSTVVSEKMVQEHNLPIKAHTGKLYGFVENAVSAVGTV